MFRGFNIENNEVEFKATLYKNRREKIGIIDNSWIKEVSRAMEDIDYIDLEIPKYRYDGKERLVNQMYFKISPMYQIVVEEKNSLGEVEYSRFCLIETTKTLDKMNGVKSFKAFGFEYKLKSKRTQFEGKVMQLISDETHIGEGILDKFIKEVPDWNIGYVDPKSRTETRLGVENVIVNLFDDYVNNNVTSESIIWEKDIATTIQDGLALYLSIEYSGLTTYDNNGAKLVTSNIINAITEPLYANITKITAKHYSSEGERFGIEYLFTLSDGVIVSRVCTLANIVDKKITCDNIRLVWETGNIIENTNIKYINIYSIDDNWYNALLDLQDEFNSVILFDNYNKQLNVIHRDNLGSNSGYVLSYDSNVIDVTVNESSEYPNALKIIGKDGVSIQSENIYGGDVIYNYDYYIRNNIMSNELQSAWNRYDTILEIKQNEFLVIKNERMTIQQRKTKLDSEIKTLNERVKNLTNLLSAYIAQGGSDDQARLKEEIDGLTIRLNECLITRGNYTNQIIALDDEIVKLSMAIKIENATDMLGKIFSEDDILELRELEVMQVYDDEYYSSPYSLLEYAKTILTDATIPQIEFDINCANLVKIINNKKGWNKVLKIGDLFNLDNGLLEDYGEKTIRLVSYTYNPNTKVIDSIKFTNKFKKIDKAKTLSDVGKKTNDSANVIGTFKEIWEDAKLSNNWVGEIIENGLNLNAQYISGKGMRNYIDITEAGIFIKDQTDTNKQIYIGSSCIGITQNGFSSSDVAISSDGIIARLLIGSVILGQKLYITSENGEFYIGDMEDNEGFGLSITDENKMQRVFLGSELVDGVRKARLRLIGKNGELALSEDGILNTNQQFIIENLSNGYDLNIPFIVDEGVTKISKVQLTLLFDKYRGYTRGSSGGGGTTQTSSGGGSFNISSSSQNGGGYTINTTTSSDSRTINGVDPSNTYAGWTGDPRESEGQALSGTKHIHTVYSNPHHHDVSINVSIPTHSHNFNVSKENHTHQVVISEHQHTEVHGIYIDETSGVNNAKIYINDILIRENINSRNVVVDITQYIKLNSINYIRISNQGNARVSASIFEKKFISW